MSLFLLCDKEEVQLYKDPPMDPQKGKKGNLYNPKINVKKLWHYSVKADLLCLTLSSGQWQERN